MIDPAQIEAKGYLTVPFATPRMVTHLSGLYETLGVDDRVPFFASANDLGRADAWAVSDEIARWVGPQLAALLPSHRPFLCSFLAKGRQVGADISFHQDLSYTDETKARTIVLWIPLVDAGAENGSLSVVPQSNQWTSGARPGGTESLATDPHQGRFNEQSVQLEIPAGTAVAYDAATVHGSPPNTAGSVRVAVGIALVPRHAQLVHVHADADADGTTTTFSVNDRYYTGQGLMNRPKGYPEAASWAQPVTPGDFEPHLKAGPI